MKFSDLITQNILFDSHCHLNTAEFDADRDEVVARAKEAGVKAIIDIGIDLDSSKKAIQDAQKSEIVYASVGIDPEILIPGTDLFNQEIFDLDDEAFEKWLEQSFLDLEKLAKEKKVLLIGETGMDNFWLEKSGTVSPEDKEKSLARQEALFQRHCDLAKKIEKPLSVHSRNAIEKCIEVLGNKGIPQTFAIFHSLTQDIEDNTESFEQKVRKILEKGFYIGVNGIVTFKNAELIRKAYKNALNKNNEYKKKFLLETDAPFLAPEPYRGKRNEPSWVVEISKAFNTL